MSGDRTAAFLREMGIGPLWVERAAPAGAAGVAEAPVVAETPVAGDAPAAVAPVALAEDPHIARLDWAGLRQAIADCSRCGNCAKPVMGAGPQSARWAVVAGAATLADEQEGVPLVGDPGRLLDNMLAAAGVAKDEAYVTCVMKCRPVTASGADRAPTEDEIAACRPFVQREIALTGAATVLTLGQVAANAMLGKPVSEPLAASRGKVHMLADGVAMVATLHPAELLRRGRDKAQAWSDLCLAAGDGPPA